MQSYNVILIGTGQATGTIVSGLLQSGFSVAVVEGDRVGGSCVNYGCTPTKTLVAGARAAHMARRSADFGVHVGSVSTNFAEVAERVNAMRNPATEGFQAWLEEATAFYPGWATFVDEHTVAVGDARIRGERIVIHTGTRARAPSFPGADTVPWLDNKGILDLTELPDHLVVIGGSYIGLEFAQAFRRYGSDVTVLQRADRLITREDPDIAEIAEEVLRSEGITVETSAEIARLENASQGLRVRYRRGEREHAVEGSHLLIGIGRIPNSDSLNLDAAGIETDSRGFIKVDEYGRTSLPHVYALGDVNGYGAFTHTSVHDGQVFMDQVTQPAGSTADGAATATPRRTLLSRTPIHSMFIDPPLARVGLSETEARALDRPVKIARREMRTINRAREKAETAGIIKILVDPETQLILGATVFGTGGDEIIGMMALAIQNRIPYPAIENTVLPHPTVSELIPFMFADLQPLS